MLGSNSGYQRVAIPATAFDRRGTARAMFQPTTHQLGLFDPNLSAPWVSIKAALDVVSAYMRKHYPADEAWSGWDCVGMGV
jgi:hypothetical protein